MSLQAEETAFEALVVREPESPGQEFLLGVEARRLRELPAGELLIKVQYSSLNYKDALSARGNRGVTKRYPHTPGIDAAGVVEESTSSRFRAGDPVVATGFDLGMNTPGGFAQYVRVPEGWALPLPQGLDARDAMRYGTAGLTAALAVARLRECGLEPGGLPVAVTGASGGVGGFAVAILASLGYAVAAVTGKSAAASYLRALGAAEVIPRAELVSAEARPLLASRWAGLVDTVGGPLLGSAVRSLAYGGTAAICGNAASPEFPIGVYPFILRGITATGIDSARCDLQRRAAAWQSLAAEWRVLDRGLTFEETSLAAVPELIERMLDGRLTGRVVIDPWA